MLFGVAGLSASTFVLLQRKPLEHRIEENG
jgi:hypothetical protein